MISILILAAGQSRRMQGADKLMQDVDGRPLLRRQIDRAQGLGSIYVALPDADHPRHAALAGTDATALIIPQAAEGMGGTLRCAVKQLPQGDFMLLLGDLIALGADDLAAVVRAQTEFPDNLIWRGATSDGRAGHPILFDRRVRPEFAKLSGDSGGEPVDDPLRDKTHLVVFDDDRARLDLDTPQDWANWRADHPSRSNNSAS